MANDNNLLGSNPIHDVMKQPADGAGIDTLGFQPGTILRGNPVHDVHRSRYAHGGAPNNGLFIDEGSKGFRNEESLMKRVLESGNHPTPLRDFKEASL